MFYIYVRTFVIRSPLTETKGLSARTLSGASCLPHQHLEAHQSPHAVEPCQLRPDKVLDGDGLNKGYGVSEEAAKMPHD